MRRVSVAVILALCAVGLVYAQSTPKLELTNLTVGLIPSAEFLPEFVAHDQGYFKAEGLTVTAPTFQAGTDIVQALVGGALNIAAGGGTDALIPISAGRPVKVIWEFNNFVTFVYLAKPTIKSWKDLKGKNIVISAPGAQTDLTVRWVLRKEGLDPDRDVKLVPGGAPLSRMAALSSGTADAAVLIEPQATKAEADGFTRLARLSDHVPKWPSEVFFATEEFIRKNPETLKAFLRAISKASKFIPANEAVCVRIMMEQMKFSEADAKVAFRLMKDSYPATGEPHIPGWDFAQELMIASKSISAKIPYEKIFDRTFIDWAKKELN
jgi:NitT/TauT family transport system substrate-binding protein